MATKLADLATVDSGYYFRGRIVPNPSGRIAVIQPKDFTEDLQLVSDDLCRVELKPEPAPSSFVHAGNILFLSRGQHPWAVEIGELSMPTIVPSSFYIVRVDPQRMRLGYLAWFINHPKTQVMIKLRMQGTNIPFISKQEFQDLPLALPSLEVQDKILKLSELVEVERRLLLKLAERRKTLIDSLCMELGER